MDQPDRELISSLFDRMRTVAVDKDQEAEAFIHGQMRQNPNSPYLLVQTVLAHEEALQGADARIRELEAEVERLRQGAPAQPAAPKASPGFTGAAAAASSAPAPWEAAAGSGPTSSVPATSAVRPASESSGWWGSKAPPNASSAAPPASASPPPYTGPTTRQGMSVPPPPQNPPQAQSGSGVGGFMRQAATTAAGVAGGVLLANSLSGLFGGSASSGAKPAAPATAEKPADGTAKPEEHAQASGQDNANDGQVQEAADSSDNNQPATQDASYDQGGWDNDNDWGNDDWGGGDDFEI